MLAAGIFGKGSNCTGKILFLLVSKYQIKNPLAVLGTTNDK